MQYDISRIKRQRLVRGMTQRALARAMDVSPETVSRMERGEYQNPKTVKKAADVLGVSMEDLVVEGNAA